METKMSSGREIPTQHKQIEEKENSIQQRREIKEQYKNTLGRASRWYNPPSTAAEFRQQCTKKNKTKRNEMLLIAFYAQAFLILKCDKYFELFFLL